MKTCYTRMIITGIALGLCLPLMAQPGEGQGEKNEGKKGNRMRERRENLGEGVKLSEEGRQIMKQHHQQQMEQMKARMQQHHEEQKAFRETMAKETDPQKMLDMLAANATERKKNMEESADMAQQARLAAFAKALEASGIVGEEREQILGRMLANQEERLDKVGDKTDELLAEIEALRAKPDLTVEDVRGVARNIARKGRDGRGDGPNTLINIDGKGRKDRERPGRNKAPEAQPEEAPAI